MKVPLLAAIVLGAGLVTPAAHAQPVSPPVQSHYDDGGTQGAGASRQSFYRGSSETLPYGHTSGFDAGITAHALTMPSVQYAIQQMTARGYVRRPDGDMGCTVPGYSVAVLGFERPGVPVSEMYPVITVYTRPFYVNRRLKWVPVTQVSCGIFRDSSGVLVPTQTAADSAFLISSTGTAPPAPGEIERAMLESLRQECVHCPNPDLLTWLYTTYQDVYERTYGSLSPGRQYYVREYSQRMSIAIGSAALTYGSQWFAPPPAPGWAGGVFSMSVAAASTHLRFMLSPPDTTHLGR